MGTCRSFDLESRDFKQIRADTVTSSTGVTKVVSFSLNPKDGAPISFGENARSTDAILVDLGENERFVGFYGMNTDSFIT